MTPGGVQRIGRHQAAVLAALARDRGVVCRLLSLNDPSGRHELKVGDLGFTIHGFQRRRERFVLAVLATAPQASMVHVAHPNLASLGLLVKLLRPRIPYAVAAYGIDVWRPLPVLRRLGLRSATAVAALSRFTAEKLIEVQGVRSSKIKNLPPAVDPGLERKRGMATVPRPPLPRGKILLTVARLETSERDKGVETVIQALPTVHRSFPDTYYVIVGDGDDRQRLERLAKDTGVASHVLFSSKVGYELVGYYDACDVFVMPSRKEGFGIVFLEAMACGKPVVGGKHGGTPECVEDGTTGFLVEYGDVITLADRLIRLLRDEGLRRRMGEAGQRRVNEEYSFEHFRERLVCLLTKTDPSSS